MSACERSSFKCNNGVEGFTITDTEDDLIVIKAYIKMIDGDYKLFHTLTLSQPDIELTKTPLDYKMEYIREALLEGKKVTVDGENIIKTE